MADFNLTKTAQAVDDTLNLIDESGEKFATSDFESFSGLNIDQSLNRFDASNAGKTSGFSVTDLNNAVVTGFVGVTSSTLNSPFTGSGCGTSSYSTPTRGLQIVAQTPGTPELWYRTAVDGGTFSSWVEILSSANTTIDGSGFVKEASPIIKLFSDSIEANEQCSGIEKLTHSDVGVYVISNTSGFSKNGWYIETPKDANGNIKVFVEYEDIGGNITVKTYEPDYSSGYVKSGDPVDIPEGRWIDIRLNQYPETEEQ